MDLPTYQTMSFSSLPKIYITKHDVHIWYNLTSVVTAFNIYQNTQPNGCGLHWFHNKPKDTDNIAFQFCVILAY